MNQPRHPRCQDQDSTPTNAAQPNRNGWVCFFKEAQRSFRAVFVHVGPGIVTDAFRGLTKM